MDSQPDVDQLIQRTRQYEFSDGLRDLQMAVYFAFSGVTLWLVFEPAWMTFLGSAVRLMGRWAVLLSILPVILPLLALLGMLRVMNYLRQRWLWQDSGMVKSRWVVPRLVNILSAVIMVGALAFGFGLRYFGRVDDAFLLRIFWAATGWGFGYTLIGVGRHIGLPRYVWLGTLGGLASTLVLFLTLPFGQTSLIFWLSWSLMLAASGAVALRRLLPFVHRNL